MPIRKIVAVGVGNAVEFYDFLTFSFFAVQIGHCFFPASAGSGGLLKSLAVFGVGFVTRPLGGFFLGLYADRKGRKPAMILSFMMIGAALLGIALIPSYDQIGIAAPILLVVFRLIQGFALGGELAASTAFLLEAAPENRRGFYVSLQYMTQDMAVLAAGIVGFALSISLTPEQLDGWGWRAAFLIGTVVIPLGLFLRRNLPETYEAAERQTDAASTASVTARFILTALLMMMATSTYIFGIDYVTTYVQDSLHMPPIAAFGATVTVGLCAVIADPISGLLSDRFGRKKVMLSAAAGILILIGPLYLGMIELRSLPMVLGATAVLAGLQGLFTPAALTAIVESLPKSQRSRGVGTVYALSTAIFGGSAQFVCKGLIDITGSELAPAYYIGGIVAVGAIAMLTLTESAPLHLAAFKRVRA
jgi:MFS family permease